LDELGQARVDLLRAEIAFAQDRGGEAPLLLLRAAQRLEPLDSRLARDTYLEAWAAAMFAGRLAAGGGGFEDVSRAAAASPTPAGPTSANDLLLDGLSQVFIDGRGAAAPALKRAVAAFLAPDAAPDDVLRWGWLASRAANLVWDDIGGLEIATRAVRLARESGALETLAVADNACGQAAAFEGDFATARLLIAEVDAVKEATGTRIPRHAAIALAGLRGDGEASAMVDDVIERATRAGQGTAVQYAFWARAVLCNGLGRYEEAQAAAAVAAMDSPPIHVATWALSELIEAATRTGDTAMAAAALARLAEHTSGCDDDWALGVLARGTALLASGEEADRAYRDAVERLARTRLRPDLARAHLLYGEWLRREGRRVDAREQLRSAYDLLSDIGMEAFAERARTELLATGERVRRRSPDTIDALTPQEEQIARLARDGMSNAAISAHLFLSPRTVEWHLRKVFAKLGVASRKDLREALPKDRRRVS
jgi:ATP/maltotriose-dependent transcriptional regulator MalT